MPPANPPLPSPRYLPFHPVSGSQTSILISESLAGLMVAATRQNAGIFFTDAGGSLAPGGMNAPAATGCADVMVVSGSLSAARLSQVAAMAEPGRVRRIKTKVRKQVSARRTSVTNTLPVEELGDAESYQNHYVLKESSCTFEAPGCPEGQRSRSFASHPKHDKRSEHRYMSLGPI